MMIDGKPEMMFSARGVVLLCLFAWKDDGSEKARDNLRRYCEYISLHGYQGGASTALMKLDEMGKDKAVTWIKGTFAQYVQDQKALVQYMMN